MGPYISAAFLMGGAFGGTQVHFRTRGSSRSVRLSEVQLSLTIVSLERLVGGLIELKPFQRPVCAKFLVRRLMKGPNFRSASSELLKEALGEFERHRDLLYDFDTFSNSLFDDDCDLHLVEPVRYMNREMQISGDHSDR